MKNFLLWISGTLVAAAIVHIALILLIASRAAA
jgi:hypothetical protein